jgi:hypothetical protein
MNPAHSCGVSVPDRCRIQFTLTTRSYHRGRQADSGASASRLLRVVAAAAGAEQREPRSHGRPYARHLAPPNPQTFVARPLGGAGMDSASRRDDAAEPRVRMTTERAIQRGCFGGVAIAAVCAATAYQRHLDVPQPAVLQARAPLASRSQGPARRVAWVLVDGLRWDASTHMTALTALGNEGRHFLTTSEFPTYTVPNFVAQVPASSPTLRAS